MQQDEWREVCVNPRYTAVIFDATVDGNSTKIVLTDVLHVPRARLNLVSQGCLEKRGIACVTNGAGRMTLQKDGRVLVSRGRSRPHAGSSAPIEVRRRFRTGIPISENRRFGSGIVGVRE